jgi:sulfoxide reductase heme-binding subunit YedZ
VTKGRLAAIKAVVWLACLAPFAWLTARAFGLGGTLGANPVEAVLLTLGKTALNTLLASLAVTPLRRLTGWNWLVRLRRLLGLFAFFYVVTHFLSYALLDLRLDWGTLGEDFTQRPFIMAGIAGLICLIPLAVTSTKGMQRRLGRNWGRLHRLVYAVGVLGVVHFYWQTKGAQLEPWIYAGVLALLLGLRAAHYLRRRFVPGRSALAHK